MKAPSVHPCLLDYMEWDTSVLLDPVSPSQSILPSPNSSPKSVSASRAKSKFSQAFKTTRRKMVSERLRFGRSIQRKRFRRTWRRGQLRPMGLLSRLVPLMTNCSPAVSCIIDTTSQTHSKQSHLARPAVRRVF